jgi:hypothetical protein
VDNLGSLLLKILLFAVALIALRELLKRGGGGGC